MNTKHTPGPTPAEIKFPPAPEYAVLDADYLHVLPHKTEWAARGYTLNQLHNYAKPIIEQRAELLEALKKLRSAFIVHTNWNGDPLAEVAEANRLITKATGTAS